MAFTISAKEIETMNQTLVSPVLVDVQCIGELAKLRVEFTASGTDNFTNKELWFNAALWRPVNTPSFDPSANPAGFFFDTTGKATGAVYAMDFIVGGNEDSAFNFRFCNIDYQSATVIEIELEFYTIFDLHDFMENGTQDILNKFRRNSDLAMADFENIQSGFYNKDVGQWIYLFLPEDTGGGGGPSTGLDIEIKEVFIPLATASDGDPASNTLLANTPKDGTAVRVYLNGRVYNVGNGVKTDDCYFSGDGGASARGYSGLHANGQIQAGDKLYWNGSIAGSPGPAIQIDTADTLLIFFIK